MKNSLTSLNLLLGSIPVKLFSEMTNQVTACIARMPPSGNAPAKRLLKMRKFVTFPKQLSGSLPVKLFFEVAKLLTASIARMPP
eukprot:5191426-Amphidinium_carterae.1